MFVVPAWSNSRWYSDADVPWFYLLFMTCLLMATDQGFQECSCCNRRNGYRFSPAAEFGLTPAAAIGRRSGWRPTGLAKTWRPMGLRLRPSGPASRRRRLRRPTEAAARAVGLWLGVGDTKAAAADRWAQRCRLAQPRRPAPAQVRRVGGPATPLTASKSTRAKDSDPTGPARQAPPGRPAGPSRRVHSV